MNFFAKYVTFLFFVTLQFFRRKQFVSFPVRPWIARQVTEGILYLLENYFYTCHIYMPYEVSGIVEFPNPCFLEILYTASEKDGGHTEVICLNYESAICIRSMVLSRHLSLVLLFGEA